MSFDLPQPIAASRDSLAKVLERKPILWVGAGLSIGAGYPSTWKVVQEMARAADDPIDTSLDFFAVADAFVRSVGKAQLSELMQKLFAEPRKPTAVHRGIARLAGAGRFHAIVTTNYDPLLEHALHDAGVPYLLQPLEDNAPITGEGEIRILKIHGSLDDWMKIILSGRAYAEFGRRFPFLSSQLDVLLRQRPVVFAGCSLQDPRIVGWLGGLSEETAESLKPWRALLTDKEWQSALGYVWQDGGVTHEARRLFARSRLRPLLLENHAHLEKLLGELAGEIAKPSAALEINLHAGSWRASLAGCADWTARDPRADPGLAGALDTLRVLVATALLTDERGAVVAAATAEAAKLRAVAEQAGAGLAEALLSDEARSRVVAAIGASTGGAPPLLLLRVHAEGDSDDARRRADRALAIPWELLFIGGEFPVESGKLDIAREAVVPNAPGLGEPDRELTVVATVAAPVDAVRLDYEGECYRLWCAMGAEERRLLITDLGTAEAFVDAVRAHAPAAIHFTGHGEPGVLLFEDDTARSVKVAVRDLIARLRGGGIDRLPRLAFLSSCYGAAIDRVDGATKDHRAASAAATADDPAWSSAAELHREGIHQVIAWLGPVADAQGTRAEAGIHAALVRGRAAREAVREARQVCRQALREGSRATHVYPLGWAQLALYHRGPEVPAALPATAAGPDLGSQERKRVIERLDASRGPAGVERLKFGFVGRRTARAEVIRRFREGCRALVIQGLGGLGKTALCAELAPILARDLGATAAGGRSGPVRVVVLDGRFAGQQPDPVAALWEQVQAFGTGDDWNQALAALQRDGITGEEVAAALVWLARREGGLLVYLDDAESLQQPVGQGDLGAWKHPAIGAFWQQLLAAAGREVRFAVLASSRYVPEGLSQAAWYPLPVMREIDLVRLVRWWPMLGRLGAADVAWLAARIDGHPRSLQWLDAIAAEQADKLSAPGRPFAGDLLREVIEPVLAERDAKLSADLLLPRLIDAVGPDAKAHLRRCAVLEEPSPWGAIVALEDVAATGKRLAQAGLLSPFEPPHGGEPLWAPHRMVVGAAGRLAENDAIEAHRRVGTWFRAQWAKDESSISLAAGAARHLCAAGDGNGAWEPARRLVLAWRHVGRYREALAWVARVLGAGATGSQRAVALIFEVQLGLLTGAPPKDAEARLKEAIELAGEQDRCFALSELGKWVGHQGRLQEAAQVLEQSVAHASKLGGHEHLDVAMSLHDLAVVLEAQGDLAGARERLERSLRIKQKVFGSDEHHDVAVSLQALAGVLQAQGDLAGARERLEQSLRIQAKLYATEEHPNVAASLLALARVLQAQGELPAAREQLEHVLRIQVKVYGTDEHPNVTASLHALAGVLQAQGDVTGARERLEHALRISGKVYENDEHPNVAALLHELALVLQAQGDLAGARERLERSLQINVKIHATDEHPDIGTSLHALAMVLHAQGDLAGARERLEQSFRIKVKAYGTEEHPDVAATLSSMAAVLRAQGDLSGARGRLERVLAIHERIYGSHGHYLTAVSEANLGGLLRKMGETKRGDELLLRAYQTFLTQLGPDHPYTRQVSALIGTEPAPVS